MNLIRETESRNCESHLRDSNSPKGIESQTESRDLNLIREIRPHEAHGGSLSCSQALAPGLLPGLCTLTVAPLPRGATGSGCTAGSPGGAMGLARGTASHDGQQQVHMCRLVPATLANRNTRPGAPCRRQASSGFVMKSNEAMVSGSASSLESTPGCRRRSRFQGPPRWRTWR